MKFEIKSWLTGGVLFSAEVGSMRLCVEAAVKQRADLTRADLADADLTDADLTDADLTGADLTGADLTRADLTRADLTDADLTPIRDDLWAVLSSAPTEVSALLDAIKSGRIDGSTYHGVCACLVGTLANAKKCDEYGIPGLTPNASRPAERFFALIHPGDTPEKCQAAKIAEGWVEDWLGRMREAFVQTTASK